MTSLIYFTGVSHTKTLLKNGNNQVLLGLWWTCRVIFYNIPLLLFQLVFQLVQVVPFYSPPKDLSGSRIEMKRLVMYLRQGVTKHDKTVRSCMKTPVRHPKPNTTCCFRKGSTTNHGRLRIGPTWEFQLWDPRSPIPSHVLASLTSIFTHWALIQQVTNTVQQTRVTDQAQRRHEATTLSHSRRRSQMCCMPKPAETASRFGFGGKRTRVKMA